MQDNNASKWLKQINSCSENTSEANDNENADDFNGLACEAPF